MRILSLALAVSITACSGSIEDVHHDSDTDATHEHTHETGTPDLSTGPFSEGTTQGEWLAQIDATSEEAWVYVDLSTPAVVGESSTWQLAFQRFNVRLHDGAQAVFVEGLTLASATDAPATGWTPDLPDADDDGVPEYALATWYDYDQATHVLSPRPGVWFVREATGATWAVSFSSYYDKAGTPAMVNFAFKQVGDAAQPVVDTLQIDATDKTTWVYAKFAGLTEVGAPATPEHDLGWDLAFRYYTIKVNGGYSGEGQGEVYTWPAGTSWDDVTTAPDASDAGWSTDVEPPNAYADGTALEWYNYDSSTHALSLSGLIHAVRAADGTPWKLTVTGWDDDGKFTIRAAPLSHP